MPIYEHAVIFIDEFLNMESSFCILYAIQLMIEWLCNDTMFDQFSSDAAFFYAWCHVFTIQNL